MKNTVLQAIEEIRRNFEEYDITFSDSFKEAILGKDYQNQAVLDVINQINQIEFDDDQKAALAVLVTEAIYESSLEEQKTEDSSVFISFWLAGIKKAKEYIPSAKQLLEVLNLFPEEEGLIGKHYAKYQGMLCAAYGIRSAADLRKALKKSKIQDSKIEEIVKQITDDNPILFYRVSLSI